MSRRSKISYSFLMVWLLMSVPTFGSAEDSKSINQDLAAVCDWVTEGTVVYYCECTKIENDIERLNCFDRHVMIEFLAYTAALNKAKEMAEHPLGREAMMEALGLPSDFDPDDLLGIQERD